MKIIETILALVFVFLLMLWNVWGKVTLDGNTKYKIYDYHLKAISFILAVIISFLTGLLLK